jgi:hypothetical protein
MAHPSSIRPFESEELNCIADRDGGEVPSRGRAVEISGNAHHGVTEKIEFVILSLAKHPQLDYEPQKSLSPCLRASAVKFFASCRHPKDVKKFY